MTMSVEPLRPEHLEGFTPTYPMPDMPEYHFGKAATFLLDGEVAAICCLFDFDGVVEVGVIQSATRRLPPITAHREARAMLRGLRMEGHRHLRAHPNSPETSKWLRLLGFMETEAGVYELWQ